MTKYFEQVLNDSEEEKERILISDSQKRFTQKDIDKLEQNFKLYQAELDSLAKPDFEDHLFSELEYIGWTSNPLESVKELSLEVAKQKNKFESYVNTIKEQQIQIQALNKSGYHLKELLDASTKFLETRLMKKREFNKCFTSIEPFTTLTDSICKNLIVETNFNGKLMLEEKYCELVKIFECATVGMTNAKCERKIQNIIDFLIANLQDHLKEGISNYARKAGEIIMNRREIISSNNPAEQDNMTLNIFENLMGEEGEEKNKKAFIDILTSGLEEIQNTNMKIIIADAFEYKKLKEEQEKKNKEEKMNIGKRKATKKK